MLVFKFFKYSLSLIKKLTSKLKPFEVFILIFHFHIFNSSSMFYESLTSSLENKRINGYLYILRSVDLK